MKLSNKKRVNNNDFSEIFGRHAVRAALKNLDRKHQKLFITKDKKINLDKEDMRLIPEINQLDNKDMNKIFGNETNHQGVVLRTSKLIQPSIEDIIHKSKEKKSDVIIILDHVNDQSNIGSIMRSCALFNCKSIIVSKNNAPEVNSNMAKAASGALEVVNYISVVNLSRTIIKFKKNNYWIYGFENDLKNNEKIENIPKKCVFVFGSEGKGLRNLTKKECDNLISIPIKNQEKFNIDSLNVSNACSIALFEHYRKNN